MQKSNFNENLFNFLAQNETTFVVVTDVDGKMVWVNKGFEHQTGYTKDELLGKKPGTLLQGEKTSKETIDLMRTAISLKKEFRVNILNYSKNGDEYWVSIDAKPYFDEKGNLSNFIAIQQNITDAKHFEIELADSLEKLKWQNYELENAIAVADREIEIRETIEKDSYRIEEILLETQKTARIGSWEIDLVSGKIYWSEVTRAIHEVDINHIPTIENGLEFYHPDYKDFITHKVQNVIENGISFDEKVIFVTARGNEIWVRVIASPVYEDGKIAKVRGIFQDINNEMLVQLELRQNENDLVESIVKMEAIINNTQSSIFALDLNYNYTAYNRNHAEGVKAILGIEIYPGMNAKDNILSNIGFNSVIKSFDKVVSGEFVKIIENFQIQNSSQYFEINLNPIIKNDEVIGVSFYSTNITDRINKENELNETLLKLEAIINNTNSFIYAIDSDYKYTAFNKQHAEAVKYSVGIDIYPGLHVKETIIEEYKNRIMALVSRVIAGESFIDVQEYIIQGESMFFESSLNPIIKNNKIIGATVFTSDITARIKKDILIKRSEERFKSIASNSPFGIFLTDTDGSCIYTNERYQEITKLTLDESLGNGWTNALHPDDKDEVFTTWAAAANSDEFYFHKTYRFIDKKSKITWVESTAVEMIENGVLTGYLGFVEDITQSVATNEELKQTQMLQRAIIDNASYAIIATDKEGIIIQFNEAAEKLLGYSADEMIGIQNPGLFHFPEQVVARTKEFAEELNLELEIGFETFIIKSKLGLPNEHEWIYVHKNGNKIPVLLSITALRNSDNEIYGFLGIAKDITNEKLANEQKFNALANIQSLVENTTDSIWSVDLDYKVLSLNNNAKAEFKQTYGVELEVGMPILEYLPYELKEVWKNRYNRALNGERYTFDEYYPTENNETYLEITINPIIAENSNVIGATIFSRNITARKTQEFQLREYSKFIESITNTSPSFVYIFDVNDLKYIFKNKDISDYLGYKNINSSTIDVGLWQYIHPDDRINLQNSLPKYDDMLENEIKYSQYRVKKADGKYIWVQSREVVFNKDDEKKPTQILVLTDDVTFQKEAELQLSETSERLRLATTGTGIGIWDWDYVNNELIWDESNYKLFEIEKDGFDNTYNGFLKYVAPQKQEFVTKSINQAILEKKDFTIEYGILAANKKESKKRNRFIRTEGKVILDDSGNIVRVIGVNFDVTERRRYEENLKKAIDEAQLANKAKSTFLANMSHEIRTPMNAILGFAELLQYENLAPKEKDYANGIITSGKSLLTLINDILDLSKIEAGKLNIKKEQVNIHNLCKDLKQVFIIKCNETGIEFKLNINERLPELLIIDEVRVRQILFNLIGNAVKFTHKGFVSLSVNFKKKEGADSKLDLHFDIEDSGIGIAKEQQSLIFDAFRQQDEQSTRKYGGTGLGLSITRRLVEIMGGKISLESELNVGSKFSIVLENIDFIQNDDNAKPIINLDLKETYKFKQSKILVVDDTPTNHLVVKGFLKIFPELILTMCSNGKKAIEELEQNSDYDLILMDIQMPVMDGFEATAIIRSNESLKSIPIIALTAYAMADDVKQISKEFDGIVTKPIVRIELLDALSKYIGVPSEKISKVEVPEKNKNWDFNSEENLIQFREKFAKASEQYKQTIDLEAIKKLVKEIREFAANKEETFLKTKCDLLESTLTNFNINSMLKILDEISKI